MHQTFHDKVRLVREIDPQVVNRICNQPSIRPWVGQGIDGPLDYTMLMGNPKNIFLTAGDGAGLVLYLNVSPGIYEVQPQVIPEMRGAWSAAFLRAALRYIALGTDAWEVLARIASCNRPSLAFAKMAGMTLEFTRPDDIEHDGRKWPSHFYRLTLQEWISRNARLFEASGWNFLEHLQDLAGRKLPIDSNAAQYTGIAKAMLELGMPVKAVTVYNRWAYLARQPMARLVSRTPLVISVAGVKAEFGAGGQIKILE